MSKAKTNRTVLTPEEMSKTIGKGLSFGAAESYKLLRTNLRFSLPPKKGAITIGVTSSLRGEGKSTTAANIAYTMAETGSRILLIEADMRLPVVAKRLKLAPVPGLSNLLSGQCSGNDVLQKSGLLPSLKVITAGAIPPNPSELLASSQMETTIQVLSEYFDYIIVDLPPVTAVSDAVTISKNLDGIVIAVRQDYVDKHSLDETVRQLKFSGVKILGFVLTDSDQQSKNYKRYGKKNYGYMSNKNIDDDMANA